MSVVSTPIKLKLEGQIEYTQISILRKIQKDSFAQEKRNLEKNYSNQAFCLRQIIWFPQTFLVEITYLTLDSKDRTKIASLGYKAWFVSSFIRRQQKVFI